MEEMFKELNPAELEEIDGGLVAEVLFFVACAGMFGIGVYNGYKGNS